MNNLFTYLKVKITQNAVLSVELAEKSPSIRNFSLADKILTIKLTNEGLKLQKNSKDISFIQEKIEKYESLFLKLNEVKRRYAYKDKCIIELNKSLVMNQIEKKQKEKIIEDYKNRGVSYNFMNKDINNFINENLVDFLFVNNKVHNGYFHKCDINDGIISGLDVYNSRFHDCNISKFTFKDCNLIKSDFYFSTINNSTFNHCDLTNANLECANIENVSFIDSNLSGAKIKVKTANFENAKLDNASIEFDMSFLKSIKNKNSLFETISSLFKTISSIDEKYTEIKTSLMKDLLLKINNIISSEYNNVEISLNLILDNIFSNKYFCKDDVIKKFITEILYTSYFNNEYSNYIDKLSPGFLSFHLDMIDNNKLISFMLNKNNHFIKLMVLSLYHENTNIKDRARALYNKYLNLKEIQPFTKTDFFGCGDKVVDWSDKSNCNYILIGSNKKIIIDHENIVNMLFNNNLENNSSWNKFYLYIEDKLQIYSEINYKELFSSLELFPRYGIKSLPNFLIFEDSYKKITNQIESNKWLSLIKLSNFYYQFHCALIGIPPSSNANLIVFERQEDLAETFMPFLSISDNEIKKNSLNIEHYQKLCEVFNITSADNKLKSQYLLSLSILIIKYSSESVFGMGLDSPEILRRYAYALMNKANELNPKLMGGNFDKWGNKLLGINKAFQCTDMLFSVMSDYGKKHFKNIFYKILPLHWR
ncbi:pentapeptide repeat-containing protein [Proteus terrae]|uniref:pentapeptide repeat-containing protein n=3 Tax=Proteus terrae TaxID=1574161 RepID=UPI00288982AD|nr:pentapeptide repeat-containing protein [Proteus terrae]